MYKTLLEKLNKNSESQIKLGLDNVVFLDSLLGFPSKKFPSVHIAGTNGKGSVSLKIASALNFSGYKVGLFTSPHISSFRERILINGKMVSKKKISEELLMIFEILEKKQIKATFFEINTLLAFSLFAKEEVDCGVIETGLGGRLDATNILNPLLSIITSINFDHMKYLGNTLEEIAFEKAGIIKKGVPLVIGPRADFESIRNQAKLFGSCLHKSEGKSVWYDQENNEIANSALQLLKSNFSIKEEAIKKALERRPSCRFEIFTKNDSNISKEHEFFPKAIVFDVAHNINAFENLVKALKYFFNDQPLRAVLGMSQDKDIQSCSRVISEAFSHIHLIDNPHERLCRKELLATFFSKEQISYKDNFQQAFFNALKEATFNDEVLVVCGSFFIMKDLRELLLKNKTTIDLQR